jgi:hypothetical protein
MYLMTITVVLATGLFEAYTHHAWGAFVLGFVGGSNLGIWVSERIARARTP